MQRFRRDANEIPHDPMEIVPDPGAAFDCMPRPPLRKEEIRAKLGLMQTYWQAALLPRYVFKELNAFFVAPHGGWRSLELPHVPVPT